MSNRMGVSELVSREAPFHQAKQIAKAEMVRRRRGLGTLTREQELAIENLLTSTATKVSDLVGKALGSWPMAPWT